MTLFALGKTLTEVESGVRKLHRELGAIHTDLKYHSGVALNEAVNYGNAQILDEVHRINNQIVSLFSDLSVLRGRCKEIEGLIYLVGKGEAEK